MLCGVVLYLSCSAAEVQERNYAHLDTEYNTIAKYSTSLNFNLFLQKTLIIHMVMELARCYT